MSPNDPYKEVKSCYAAWSSTYYDDYYGEAAAYPPIHRELIRSLLVNSGARNVLDAGCGPASFLREMVDSGIDLYGFDLTPEMVAEARKVLEEHGAGVGRVWEGSVLDASAFQSKPSGAPDLFDAVVCIGVLPHVPNEETNLVFTNIHSALRPGGLAIVEARNKLFSLFTLNRYSYNFFEQELIKLGRFNERLGDQAHKFRQVSSLLQAQFRMDLPPRRRGDTGVPGYDEILSQTHNPLVLKDEFCRVGFHDVRVLFYHYHCLPPMLEGLAPELFRRESLAIEDPDDWRGHFMASAFLLAGKRT